MKCTICGKKLARGKYYKVTVLGVNGDKMTTFLACPTCGYVYQIISEMANKYGVEVIESIVKDLIGVK